MKKILAILLALTCLLALAGCGGAADTEEPEMDRPATDSEEPEIEASDPEGMAIAIYDANGDGILQTLEFPVPTGETFGLTGGDAVLYTQAAKAAIERTGGDLSTDTMLILPTLRVYGAYDGDNGETHYVCGFGAQYYYDLGEGLADPENPVYSGSGGGGGIARITIAEDGALTDIQETYDGGDNTKRIQELCGPLTELAEALNQGGDLSDVERRLTPTGDELLLAYLKYYFPME